jgi:putative Holliday junction resolvase
VIYNNINQLNQDLPEQGRIMALDVGTKTIGVAISDATRIIATPKITLNRKGNQKDFVLIKKIIDENNIAALIIGLPLHMDGSESEITQFIKRFADNLDKFLLDFKMVFFDERLSSFEAEDILNERMKIRNNKKKQLVDQIAASVILQSALDEIQYFKTNI